MNFIIAMIILAASIATAATWSYDCPSIEQFRPDISYKLFGRQEVRPMYVSLRNIDFMIRSKPSNIASILDALLSVPPKYDFQGHGKINCCKEPTDIQLGEFKEGLQAYFSLSQHTCQHWKA
jgi:hypothetical protein